MPSALFFHVGHLKSKFHFYSLLDNRKGSEFLKPLKTYFLEVLLFEKNLSDSWHLSPSCNNLQTRHGFLSLCSMPTGALLVRTGEKH